MQLSPRFTNGIIKALKAAHNIDLFQFKGPEIADPDWRLKVMIAGHPGADATAIEAACDDLTPGEHTELLLTAFRYAFQSPSTREAAAKAAPADKSEAA